MTSKEEIMALIEKADYEQVQEVLKMLEERLAELEIEAINEDTVYADDYNHIYIAVTPDAGRGFVNEPYFKVSWKPIGRNNPYVARISMVTGDYIIHNGASVELTSDIIKKIDTILGSKIGMKTKYSDFDEDDKNGTTVWNALLYATAIQCGVDYKILKAKFGTKVFNPDKSKLRNCRVMKWGRS